MGEEPPANYIAEFIGTFLLVFTVGCNVVAGSAVWGVTSIAAVLMVSIYALGGVSGANLNPAVSVALGCSGKMEWSEVLIYCCAQVTGGLCAGVAYSQMLGQRVHVAPRPSFGWWEAGLAEAIYTCVLCFVVLNCACSSKNGCSTGQQFYGLAIGFVVVAGGYGAGAISGGAFNPAVALGLDVMGTGVGMRWWSFVYVLFEIAGAVVAAALFRLVRPDDFGGSPDYDLSTKCLSECIGTYVLVLTVGLNILGGSPAGAWSIAASLMCMVYALGNCSGAHFNPAVTTAIMLTGRGKCPPKEGCAFIICQLLSGICASMTYTTMHHGRSFPLEPVAPHSWYAALAGEAAFTFLLCFVVLSVATVESPLSQYFGLAIGSCVTAGGLAIGNVSGGSLNPAVSAGISSARVLQHNSGAFDRHGDVYNCLMYSLFEILGAVAAAGVFSLTHPQEFSKGPILPILQSRTKVPDIPGCGDAAH